MTAREMAEGAVARFLGDSGECPGNELACDDNRNQVAYDLAWENFLNNNDEEFPIPDFCIVEDYVHEFLLYGV